MMIRCEVVKVINLSMVHRMKKKILLLCNVVSVIVITMPSIVLSRSLLLTGTGDAGIDYNSNIYKTKENPISELRTYFAPELILSSAGSVDNFDLSFSPKYTYNHRRAENYLSADLSASVEKSLSARLNFDLSNDFSYSNTPPSEVLRSKNLSQQFIQLSPEIQSEIVRFLFPEYNWPGGQFDPADRTHIAMVQSEIQGRYNTATPSMRAQVDDLVSINTFDRRNYFSNTIGFNTHYEYLKESQVSFGYSYTKNENDTSIQSDVRTYNPHIKIQHTFSDSLMVTGSYDYRKNNYDFSDDSENHKTILGITYKYSHATYVVAKYTNSQLDYSGTQNGNSRDGVFFDLVHSFNDKINMNISLTPYHIDNENSRNERGYSFAVGFNQTIKHGQISFNIDRTAAESDMVLGWDDLRRSWTAKTNFKYVIYENLSSDTSLSYGERENWFGATKSAYDDYEASIDISYPLNKVLLCHVKYSFNRLDSDNIFVDDYDENQITFRISGSEEMWRW